MASSTGSSPVPPQKCDTGRVVSSNGSSPVEQLEVSMASTSRSLPIRVQRSRIINKVQLNRVTLIVAKTGSGKSSQVPQMLLEEGLGPVLCTQPRRLAVVAISKVVAEERGCQLGSEVGFHIGQKKVLSPESKIIFETTGVLLQELRSEGAKVLSRYKVVIFDEVHERSIESDLALTCIKQFMLRNANIRLVLMSATFDCQFYKDYFKDLDRSERVEIIPISSSDADSTSMPYKVEVSYLEDVTTLLKDSETESCLSKLSSNLLEEKFNVGQQMQELITSLVAYLHTEEKDLKKNILIFLPTYAALEDQWSLLKHQGLHIKVFVLHSSIDMDHSLHAMEVSLSIRKVILATNVAESSVTIPGVSYIIDSCLSLEIFWDNDRRKRLPRLVWVSKSQADQRKGRTGRTCDGQVFRMVPKKKFHDFSDYEKPAIQLLSLREQVLMMCCSESKAINDPKVFFAKSMDPPLETTVQNAIDALESFRALKVSPPRGKFIPTSYGKLIASLPLSLEAAILVVKGGQMGLLRETTVLAALMDSSPFPIVHPFGHDIQYQMFLERFYKRTSSLHGESKKFSHVSVLLANLQAFEFWQCTLKDKQRLERLIKYATGSKTENADELVFTEAGEQLWCTQHGFTPSALQAIFEISANVMEKMHLFRPKFLTQSQSPPAYYMAYDFCHTCEFLPDEENLAEKIILLDAHLDSELGICCKDEYVLCGQFHPPKDIETLRNLIGQVQKDFLEENIIQEEAAELPLDDETSLCRYFQRGACMRGSECHFSHDFSARRSVCKYFMSEYGCRYGELCEFRHVGGPELPTMQELNLSFEEGLPSAQGFLNLWPLSEEGTILVYGEEDFSFTWNLSRHYSLNLLLATSVNQKEMACSKAAVEQRVSDLTLAGVEILWGVNLEMLHAHNVPTIPFDELSCVLWTIKRDSNEEHLAKQLLGFFSTLSVTLLSEGRADIAVLLTMYNDQFSRAQVERIARDCFFFLEQSVPFDSASFGVYTQFKCPVFGDPKPVTYLFQLVPPSAGLHGDYFWHLQQAFGG